MSLDLQALGAIAANLCMGLAGNAKSTCSIVLAPGGTYDPENDTTTGASAPLTGIPCLPYHRRERKGAEEAAANTKTLMIEAAALPAGTTITESARITEGGYAWTVANAERDPTGATWILDLRR